MVKVVKKRKAKGGKILKKRLIKSTKWCGGETANTKVRKWLPALMGLSCDRKKQVNERMKEELISVFLFMWEIHQQVHRTKENEGN